MKKLPNIYKNESISWGTLKTEDLLDSFLAFAKATKRLTGITEGKLKKLYTAWEKSNKFEDMEYLLNEDIFNLMNEIAPEGCYFGSHIGDGSDFGFWEIEEV